MKEKFLLIALLVCCRTGAQVPDYRNDLKITFLSWGTGSAKISYERVTWPNQTDEITFGLISMGYDKFGNDPNGITVRYAHKWIIAGNVEKPLEGLYIRPELVWSQYRYDNKSGERTTSDMCALFGTAGYQHVWKRLVMDGFIGFGPCTGYRADTYYQHGFITCKATGANIAYTFGMKVGVAF